MNWIQALKAWNKKTGTTKYTIPKKGTKEYGEVMAMMGKNGSKMTTMPVKDGMMMRKGKKKMMGY